MQHTLQCVAEQSALDPARRHLEGSTKTSRRYFATGFTQKISAPSGSFRAFLGPNDPFLYLETPFSFLEGAERVTTSSLPTPPLTTEEAVRA